MRLEILATRFEIFFILSDDVSAFSTLFYKRDCTFDSRFFII